MPNPVASPDPDPPRSPPSPHTANGAATLTHGALLPPHTPEITLEALLATLTRANGCRDTLFDLLLETWPTARVTALIAGLLTAERALRDVFRENTDGADEGPLAAATALAMAKAANALEQEMPGRFIRLSDIAS
jgi:hypothetical protein